MLVSDGARQGVRQVDRELWPARTDTVERDRVYESARARHTASGQGLHGKTSWNYGTLSIRQRKISVHFIHCFPFISIQLNYMYNLHTGMYTIVDINKRIARCPLAGRCGCCRLECRRGVADAGASYRWRDGSDVATAQAVDVSHQWAAWAGSAAGCWHRQLAVQQCRRVPCQRWQRRHWVAAATVPCHWARRTANTGQVPWRRRDDSLPNASHWRTVQCPSVSRLRPGKSNSLILLSTKLMFQNNYWKGQQFKLNVLMVWGNPHVCFVDIIAKS